MQQVLVDNSVSVEKKLLDKKYTIQFIPVCMSSLVDTQYFYFQGKKLKSSYALDIVHNLLLKYYYRKENLFNLSSTILKEKYGYQYNFYIQYLIECKIITLVKKHLKGKNARIYQLNEKIIKENVIRFKNKDKVLLKKYKNSIIGSSRTKHINNLIDDEIKEKLVRDLFSVEIDFEKSIFFLDSTIQENEIYRKNKYSVESIKDGHIFFHFDNYGRFHTNFTILKSFIRKNCLMIEGEELCELDIQNSQPLFLCKIFDSCSNNINVSEKEFYKHLTKNGLFYEHLRNNFESKDKKKIKEITYKVFFGKNYKNKYDDIFKKSFPTIYDFIKQFKKNNSDYKSLSYELQKFESNFIFNKVVKKIMIEHPHIKLISCHDSILCKKTDKVIVDEIFSDLLYREFL